MQLRVTDYMSFGSARFATVCALHYTITSSVSRSSLNLSTLRSTHYPFVAQLVVATPYIFFRCAYSLRCRTLAAQLSAC